MAQSDVKPTLTYPVNGWEIKTGDRCELGSQLRPHVVLYGEEVPNFPEAAELCSQADIFILVGTSLKVPPVSGIVNFLPRGIKKYTVDLAPPYLSGGSLVTKIVMPATLGVQKVVNELMIKQGDDLH